MRSRGGLERADGRFTQQPQKERKGKKKKLSFAFLAAIRFKRGQTFDWRGAGLVQEDWIVLKAGGILELEGPSTIPSTRDEEVSGGYI